jgi:hypothetical protein
MGGKECHSRQRAVRSARPWLSRWITLPRADLVVSEQKREHGKPSAVRDAGDLVQMGTGKDERRTGLGPVEVRAVFRKPQVPAVVVLIQSQGEGKPAVGGGGTEIVAVGVKHAAGGGGIAGNFEAFKARGLKRKGFVHFGEDPPTHGGGEEPQQLRVSHKVVLPGLLGVVNTVLPLQVVGVLHPGVHVATRFPDVDEGLTQVWRQHAGNEQDGRLGMDC